PLSRRWVLRIADPLGLIGIGLSIEVPGGRTVVCDLAKPTAKLPLRAQAPPVDVGRFVVQLPQAIAGHLRQQSSLSLYGVRKVDRSIRSLEPNHIRFVEESRDDKRNVLLRMGSPILRPRQ